MVWGDFGKEEVSIEEFKKLSEEKLGERIIIVRNTREIMNNKVKYILVLNKVEIKIRLMKKKELLKGTGIWVDNDYMEQQARVLQWLEDEVQRLRKEGKRASRNYMKVLLEGKWWYWDEILGRTMKMPELIKRQKYRDES